MKKRILIVDDEESVLLVLQNSLVKLGKDYDVVTASNAFLALEYVQEQPFDLIVTDYKMADMDGLQLMEAIRTIRADARIIMMTAYGTDALEAEANRLEAYKFLTKPLEISAFRQIVKEALSSDDVAISRPGILILSDTRFRQMMALLLDLQGNVGGRCILLTDANGQMIAHTGDVGGLHLEEISSLLCGGMATMQAAGSALDGDENAIHLSYREGTRDNLYVVNIGAQLLLILIIENSPYSTRLGSAWYYARQTALTLRQTLGEADHATNPEIFNNTHVDEEFDTELDKLFEFGLETTPTELGETAVSSTSAHQPPVELSPSSGHGELMSFRQAMAKGLFAGDPGQSGQS